jgi:hypothetical protein
MRSIGGGGGGGALPELDLDVPLEADQPLIRTWCLPFES